jgi:dCTP deaminase
MNISDRDIRKAIECGAIAIRGYEDFERQLQPASFDVRLLGEFFRYDPPRGIIDPKIDASLSGETFCTDRLVLMPGEFVLGSTIESVKLGPTIGCRVDGRSSIGRMGITVHITAGFCDPGFEGRITLEIANLSGHKVALYAGMAICQLVFEEMSSPVERPYAGKYQGQTGVVASRMNKDFE